MRQDQPNVDPFSRFMEEHPQEGEKALELNWEGQDLLNAGKIKAAERKFREAIAICEYAIPPLNNLALCLQLRGDTKRAIRTAHRVLESQPTNVFAHCTLAECYQNMERTVKARSYAERALALLEDPAVPLDNLVKVLETMAKLQWDEKIMDIYRSYHEGIGFEDVLDGISWFYLGVAAANLGLLDDAIAYFGRALNDDPRITLAELYIKTLRLVQDNKVPQFRFFYQTEDKKQPVDPKHPSEEIKPIVATGLWSEQEDEEYRHQIVALLGMWEDTWAEEFLRLILIQPKLPDDIKMHAATALIERGAVAEDEKIEMFIGGMKQPVIINKKEIPSPPPEAVKQFELGLAQRQAGNIIAAEKAYRRALEISPDFPEVLVNLANICRSTDRTDEGVRLLERAVDLSESPTAILNLAAAYILEQERIDEGSDLLSMVSLDDIDADLLPLYYRMIGHMYVFDGEFQAAREAFNKLITLLPNDEAAKDLLEWVARAEALHNDDMSRWRKRRDRYLKQPVDPAMPLLLALHTLTKDNLIGITYWYDLAYGTLRKSELAQMIADHLQNEEIDIWEDISDNAWEVLRFLRGVGGSAPLAKLEEKFGSTEDDSIDWRYEIPYSAIGELQAMGIVFVGQSTDKETIAFIPKEILSQLMRKI